MPTTPLPFAVDEFAVAAHRPVVLLVDDDGAEACLLEEALRDCACNAELHHVRSGWDALRWVGRRGVEDQARPRPDVILVDLDMPAMPGHELVMHLRRGASRVDAAVIVYSNSTRVSDIRDCRRLGADHFIIKPYGYDGYLNVIDELKRWFRPRPRPA